MKIIDTSSTADHEIDNDADVLALVAASFALNALIEPCQIALHTDSRYVIDGITGWVFGWARAGWKRKTGPIENLGLWHDAIRAAAVRFRPMLLTALAVVVGASVILADPIFQGLALALMAGEVASLLISRFAVPILYFMVNRPPVARPASGG